MKRTVLISAAAAALIAGSGLVFAQGGGSSGGNAAGGAATGGASGGSSGGGAPAAVGPGNSSGGAASEGGGIPQRGQAQTPGERGGPQRAQGNEMKGGKNGGKAATDSGMERSRDQKQNNAQEMRDQNQKQNNARDMRDQKNNAAEGKSGTTTGQAGAGGKQLTTEQRTSIRTAITKENVKPVTNINFSVSVGTRVPRTVGFHPLPTEVVTIYPEWRGYEFFLAGDQIVVVNPRTLEIVAILEA